MNLINKFISITFTIFTGLLFILFYLILNNINNASINIISVLIGSSLTATITLILESIRLNEENKKLKFSIISELEFNKMIFKHLLDNLIKERDRLRAEPEGRHQIINPGPPIKTALWDIISPSLKQDKLGDTYNELLTIVANTEYINSHLKHRDEFIYSNIDGNLDFSKLLEYDEIIILNVTDQIQYLDNFDLKILDQLE